MKEEEEEEEVMMMWECGIEYGFELLSGHWYLQNLEIFLSLFCILIGKLQFGD